MRKASPGQWSSEKRLGREEAWDVTRETNRMISISPDRVKSRAGPERRAQAAQKLTLMVFVCSLLTESHLAVYTCGSFIFSTTVHSTVSSTCRHLQPPGPSESQSSELKWWVLGDDQMAPKVRAPATKADSQSP